MPVAADLVTNLPTQFNTFGQGVDTSMAELKGGTTGQVLSKTSATDMDFTWVTTDDANAIQNAIVDAKGDIIGATAADTPARLAVGANSTILMADSAQATGLKWAGAWTTWTPTLDSMSLGNGTVTARYVQIGKTIDFSFKFVLGSTSTISTNPRFTLPTTPLGLNNINFTVQYYDDNSGAKYIASAYGLPGFPTSLYLTTGNSGAISFASATTPITWATSDIIFVTGSYETT
jgi:hypothetical protein